MTKESVNSGRQLKFAREYRKYTQAKLCKDVKELSQSNLSKYEQGFEGMLKNEKVLEIMNFLNFPIEFLEKTMPDLYTSFDL
jgi:transcriptional regulator with XRE-family HTH domain